VVSAESDGAAADAKQTMSEPLSESGRETVQERVHQDTQTQQEPRRSSRRRSSRRRRSTSRGGGEENGGRTGSDASEQTSGAQKDDGRRTRILAELLAETWTEDKARKLVSEGFIASLAPRVVSNEKDEPLSDLDALKAPLQMIRKNLADECMIEDDATDVMLLDMVMNALSDRIEVYQLQAQDGQLEEIDHIVKLRHRADRRLIETINALKNA